MTTGMRVAPETLTLEKSFRVHRCPVCGEIRPYETIYADRMPEGTYIRCVATEACDHIPEKEDDGVYR